MSDNVEAPLPIGGADGTKADMRRGFSSGGLSRLSEAAARCMLEDCMRFLWQVAMITSEVVGSVQVGAFRKIAAADCAATGSAIGEDGRPLKIESAPEHAPNKGPRGARHPLMVLVSLGVGAVRLLRQIIRGVFPEAVGELSQLDKFEEQIRVVRAKGDAALFK